MNAHPYRALADLDSNASSTHATGCLFCRSRAALARVRMRTLVLGVLAVLFVGINVASVVIGTRTLREAKKTLAQADALDSSTRQTLRRYEERLRQAAKRPPPPEATTAARPYDPPPKGASGIARISDNEFYVDRYIVDEALSDGVERPGHPSVTPTRDHGRVSGVRLSGIRSDTLLHTLGLQDGDVVQAVNGFDITEPEAALEAYARLRSEDEVIVRIKRSGATQFLHYHLT